MSVQLKIGQPRFLSKPEVLTLHRASLDAYGGADGFLNEGALDSAIAQPMQGFGGQYVHDFPYAMAAAYGFHIAMNHPFRDGNKRTAFAAMTAFLRMNGWDFSMPDEEAAGLMLTMIESHHDKAWLAAHLMDLSKVRNSFELRDFFAAIAAQSFVAAFQSVRPDSPGNTTQQLQATADEVAAGIPLVINLLALNRAAVAANDDHQRIGTTYMILTLFALYRLAEDAGYEW